MKNNMDYFVVTNKVMWMKLEFRCSSELTAFTDTPHTKLHIYRKHSNSRIFCQIGWNFFLSCHCVYYVCIGAYVVDRIIIMSNLCCMWQVMWSKSTERGLCFLLENMLTGRKTKECVTICYVVRGHWGGQALDGGRAKINGSLEKVWQWIVVECIS